MKCYKVILNGYPKSGKDEFINQVTPWLHDKGLGVHNVSSVDRVKSAARILGWDGAKDDKGRQFLSDLKDLSTEAYEGPFKYLESRVYDSGVMDRIMFFHIREPQEIKKFVDKFPDTRTILIKRREAEEYHPNTGDRQVEGHLYDMYFNNNGSIEDLRQGGIDFLCALFPDLEGFKSTKVRRKMVYTGCEIGQQ